MKTAFKNATIVTPAGNVQGDLVVENGKILSIGGTAGKTDEEYDCTDLHILPGAIDMHVHLRDPGWPDKEDFSSGTAAAAAGGVTTIIDMPNTMPLVTTVEALEKKRAFVSAKANVNFGLYMALTDDNFDEIQRAKHIMGVKVWMARTTGDLVVRSREAFEKLLQSGLLTIVHAEDEEMIEEGESKFVGSTEPAVHSMIRSCGAALMATKQAINLAKKYNGRLHITHVSTAAEVEEIQKSGMASVTADCTPHHLFLNETAYMKMGNFAKVNPPLRSEEDCRGVWKGLQEGIITAVATDHAPHTKAEKQAPYAQAPAGVPGLETMLPLLLDRVGHGKCTIEDVVRWTSTNPAQILGLATKGSIAVGMDADLAIVDMLESRTVGSRAFFTKCGWSPFEGRTLKGLPMMTVVNGQVVFEGGKLVKEKCGKDVEKGVTR